MTLERLPINEVPKLPMSAEQVEEIQELRRQMKELGVSSVNIQFPKPGFYEHIVEMLPYVSSISLTNPELSEEQAAIASLSQADPSNFQVVAASKLELSNSYYNNALRQSQQSFLWARIWGGVGVSFIIIAVLLIIMLHHDTATSIIIALLGGAGGGGAKTIADVNHQLYKQASDQAAACHIRLDRASDFILANSACEGLDGEEKKAARADLIRKFIDLPATSTEKQRQ